MTGGARIKLAPRLALVITLALGIMVLASACGGGGAIGKITAADGQYTIAKVEVGDRLPPDCSGSECRIKPGSDYEVVVVRLQPKFGFAARHSVLEIPCVEEDRIYVVAGDGSRSRCVLFSTTFGPALPSPAEEFAMVFRAPAFAEGFTLFVPDNPPVDLGR